MLKKRYKIIDDNYHNRHIRQQNRNKCRSGNCISGGLKYFIARARIAPAYYYLVW